MDPARLLRLHRACLRGGDSALLRARAALGECGAAGSVGLLRTAADALLSVLLAPVCTCCARSLAHPLAGAACEACWASVTLIRPPLCASCGEPLPDSGRGMPGGCFRCRRLGDAIARARAAGVYDGALRDIIHAFKYGGRRSLAIPLAALMRVQGAAVLSGAHAAVAVPLHQARRRERGFNQAEDLAARLGLPVVAALRRVAPTRPQASLPADARRQNVSRAFAARRGARGLVGLTVVVVDDVLTTGATIDACARVLRRAGAREVRALTAARVVLPPP